MSFSFVSFVYFLEFGNNNTILFFFCKNESDSSEELINYVLEELNVYYSTLWLMDQFSLPLWMEFTDRIR